MLRKFFQTGLVLVSAGLGFRQFMVAAAAINLDSAIPELKSRPDVIALAAMGAPFDILAGFFLLFWPFYLAWLEDRWKKSPS